MTMHFNLADLFEKVADTVPDREALVCGEQRATFAQLESRANQLAHYLLLQGVGAGDHVGLYMYNSSEFIEAMWACFKIRAVPVNVNYRYVQDELFYIFDNAELVACFHNREFTPHIAEIQHQVSALKTLISVEDGTDYDFATIGSVEFSNALVGQSPQRDFTERSDEDLFLLYTGGTTGMPKGVMWPHKNLFMAAMGGGGFFTGNGPAETPEAIVDRISDFPIRGMALAPLMHGACWWYACIQMLAGCCLLLNPNRSLNGEQIWQMVEDEKINGLSIVGDAMAIPLLDALKANKDKWDLSSIFNIGSGGAVFSPAMQQQFVGFFPNVFITNSFGSSESGNMGFDSGNNKKNGSGSSLGNVAQSEFMDVITDIEGEPHRHATIGEEGIFARSGYIPTGYYADPIKTAETFVEVNGKTWLLTGDAACLEDDSSITIFGRGSNCINSGGEKIFPEEVEQALKHHPAVFDALVVDTPHSRWGHQVTAVVQLREGYDLDLHSLNEETRKHIADYKVPRELHIVAELPRAPSGKPAYPKAKKMALSREFLVS